MLSDWLTETIVTYCKAIQSWLTVPVSVTIGFIALIMLFDEDEDDDEAE